MGDRLHDKPRFSSALGERALSFEGLLACACMLLGVSALAQTVQPVISEYQMKADGKFALTNGTLTPMVVVLEPKSFSITPDGQGVFRSLDHGIHIELSAMSARLEPGQTYYVFTKPGPSNYRPGSLSIPLSPRCATIRASTFASCSPTPFISTKNTL